jgi:putative PIN family toxin of toxin-antitoxin system
MSNKVKVVIDTNVLVSALWSETGIPAEILKMIPESIVPCVCETILEEYSEVLNRPKFDFSASKKEKLLKAFEQHGEMVLPETSDNTFIDESDRIFYDIAKTANATLITGNLKHYPSEPHIVSPANFMSSNE